MMSRLPMSDLKSVLEKGDKDTIETKTAALAEASAGMAQKLYAEQAGEGEEGAAEPQDGRKQDG